MKTRLKLNISNTSHIFWDQSPYHHYQCCLQVSETVFWHKLGFCQYNVVCKYLRQFLGTSLGVANILQHWVEERGLIYFCKVDHSRISRNVSRNWVGFNNFCEILRMFFLRKQFWSYKFTSKADLKGKSRKL